LLFLYNHFASRSAHNDRSSKKRPFLPLLHPLVRAYPRNNSGLWFCATFRIRQINARVKQQKRPCVMIARRLMERRKTLARRSQNIHFQLQELGPKITHQQQRSA
jgi:hypothetical protein